MPDCILLTSYPVTLPKHGGQVRAASIMRGAQSAGWKVSPIGIYPAAFFSPSEWGVNDIVLDSALLRNQVLSDLAFGDLHLAHAAAADMRAVKQLRRLIIQLAPEVIHVEQPWLWLVLREALPSAHRIKVIYSSQNVEWRARLPLFDLNLGLRNDKTEEMMEATRRLESEFAVRADLVMSISDVERDEIEKTVGRSVVFLPAASDLPSGTHMAQSHFTAEARAAECSYAALVGSDYWPNVDGFFKCFQFGLGFLAADERIWIGGAAGPAIQSDLRFLDHESINRSRTRVLGFIDDNKKSALFSGASCVIVPVLFGAGAKLKTADGIYSGKPVIATGHALEGYKSIIKDASGCGVYEAATPLDFRRLIKHALRDGLPGCAPEVRERLSMANLAMIWSHHAGALLAGC